MGKKDSPATSSPSGSLPPGSLAPGSLARVVRRAQWGAIGLPDDAVERPKIAVVNSSGGFSICYAHLDEIAAAVASGIEQQGGVSFEVRTGGPSDGIFFSAGRGRHLVRAREAITEDIVTSVDGAGLDGMVLLASCDSTTPAQLLAAVRLDLPTIVLACGYQAPGRYRDKAVNLFDVYERMGDVERGRMPASEIEELAACAIGSPGVCPGMGTANTFHMLTEALGIALPGSTPICGGSARLRDCARRVGERIVDMIGQGPSALEILTPAAFRNAIRFAIAVGGAPSSVSQLGTVAAAAGLDVDIRRIITQESQSIPLLAAIEPNGRHGIDELEAAGGAAAVLKQLEGHLEGDAPTVSGETLRENLARQDADPSDVVHTLADPLARQPGLALLSGELAPRGAYVRPPVGEYAAKQFTGPARHIASAADAMAALVRGDIHDGDVIVFDGNADDFACCLAGTELHGRVAIVAAGGFSGLSRGLVVGLFEDPGQAGSPLAAVEEGVGIRIDLERLVLERAPAGASAQPEGSHEAVR